jgi:hypothetical protein
MKIIDSHAHIYPDRIAAKASENTGAFYGLPTAHDGTVSTLLASGNKAGVGRFVVHSVATAPEQVSRINDFIAKAAAEYGELIGFAAMHPDLSDAEAELDRVREMGLKGVKMHPDVQCFAADDPKMDRVYDALQGKMPLLLHAGDKRYGFSNPHRIAKVLDKFPKLDVIAAHFGGYSEWDDAEYYLAGRRIWVDTSSSLMFIPPERAWKLVNAFGADQVLFGTDYPMWDVFEELERFDTLNLTSSQRERILYKNILRLLGMET